MKLLEAELQNHFQRIKTLQINTDSLTTEPRDLRLEMASKGAGSESIILDRKRAIVSSLCQHLSLDQQSISSESVGTSDIKGLFSNILKLSGHDAPLKNEEVMKWVAFADVFPLDSEVCRGVMRELNEDLTQKSVLLGGLKPSEADIVVFSAVHSFVSGLAVTERQQFPNVLRWMDYIQNKEDLGEVFEKIPVQKIEFEPQASKSNGELESNRSSKKSENSSKVVEKLEADSNSKKSSNMKELVVNNKATEENKKAPETKPLENDGDVSISLLNVQVGLIRKAWKHPSADSLLVEEIDLGDGNVRQVVSGLAKYCSPDDLVNRRVVIIANVKPGKLRDVLSAGLVLCASNQDHTVVEPLLPPQGAKLGERVQFSGHDGKPEDVLNPKKKQLEKITPHLFTDDKGVATFNGIPFMTSAGPCTSSIPNGSIK